MPEEMSRAAAETGFMQPGLPKGGICCLWQIGNDWNIGTHSKSCEIVKIRVFWLSRLAGVEEAW